MMRAALKLFLLTPAIGACTPAESAPGAVVMSDSAGATVVLSREPRWTPGDAWTVSSEPSVVIGVLEGAEAYQLFAVSAAARQSDGDIVVAEGGSGRSKGTAEVRLYDREGGFVRTLGGSGSGPGEFLNPDRVLVSEGDTVSIWDNTALRVTRFDPAGELVDVETVELASVAKVVEPPLYPATVSLLPGGDLLVRLVEKAAGVKGGKAPTPQSPPQSVFRERSGALRVSFDRSRVDTLMFFGGTEQERVDAPWGPFDVVPPAARTTVIAVQPTSSTVCIGAQEAPEVVCFRPDGSRTVVRWTSEPAPLGDEAIAEWRDSTAELYALKMNEADVLRVLEQVTVPAYRPPYARLILDRAGNLWVELGGSGESATKAIDHLVFDPDGVLLGTVALPAIEVLEIGDDYVLGVYRDELEVEYLHLYGIVKPSAGARAP